MSKRWLAGMVLASLVAGPVAAQQHQHEGAKDHGKGKGMMMETAWKELNEFHAIMHLMHQPLKQSGDLTQVRGHAAHLAQLADTWAGSKAPAECAAPATAAETVTAFAAEVKNFAAQVEAKAADDVLKAGFTTVHDRFEGLHALCKPAKGAHQH